MRVIAKEAQAAGVVGGDAPLQSLQPLVVAEDVEVFSRNGGGALLDDGTDAGARRVVVEAQPGVQALLDGCLASGAAQIVASNPLA